MPRPENGKQIRLCEADYEKIRQLFIDELSFEDIVKQVPCRKSNFFRIVKPVREQRDIAAIERMSNKLSMLTEPQKGWVAGIIDSEGWIGLLFKDDYIHPRICVGSATPIMQTTLQDWCGGAIYQSLRKTRNCRNQQGWTVDCVLEVAAFLVVIEPYLVVKKHISQVVREFVTRRAAKRWAPYEKADYEAVQLVAQMNARGRRSQLPSFKPQGKSAIRAREELANV